MADDSIKNDYQIDILARSIRDLQLDQDKLRKHFSDLLDIVVRQSRLLQERNTAQIERLAKSVE